MPRYDLHSHSTYSDGTLSPAELVARAAACGVDVLALTDHDELAGLAEAKAAADAASITLIAGTEISVTWEYQTLHVVALGIDPAAPALAAGLAGLRAGRTQRARRIADGLAEAGIGGAYEGALRYVTGERLVSRTHFARFLVEAGHARDIAEVFRRFLTRDKPGYVAHAWAPLAQAVGWIRAAGGQAVLAHPGRYTLSPSRLRHLLAEFRDAGGAALEVLSSAHTAADIDQFTTLARVYGFQASCGSDFHSPHESRVGLGALPSLPAGLTPVWQNW